MYFWDKNVSSYYSKGLITHSDYLATNNDLFVKLCILKLKCIIAYKSYLSALSCLYLI